MSTDPEMPEMPDERELLDLIADISARMRAMESHDVPEEFVVLIGVCVQAIRLAESYLILQREAHGREGSVVARAALEHAITAQWCFHRAGGMHRLGVEVQRDAKRYFTEMGRWTGQVAVVAAAEAVDYREGEKGMLTVTQMFKEFDPPEPLTNPYMDLSRITHVTSATLGDFVKLDDAGDIESIELDPRGGGSFPATYVAAGAAMYALNLVAELNSDTELLQHLDAESDRLSVPMSVRDALPEEKRRVRR